MPSKGIKKVCYPTDLFSMKNPGISDTGVYAYKGVLAPVIAFRTSTSICWI